MTFQLAPIVLFVFQRPDYTRRALQSLRNNALADHSKLIIYADGPKWNASVETLAKIAEVRAILREEKWCGEVEIHEAEHNRGLAISIIEGVTQIVEKYGRVIVLEDDLELSPYFLQFMNDALEVYADSEKVMHINGYLHPIKNDIGESALVQFASPWGWATWKRAWRHYAHSYQTAFQQIQNPSAYRTFTFGGVYPYDKVLQKTYHGHFDSWFIRWLANIIAHDGLSLFPGKSLVRNFGVDNTGTNCVEDPKYDVALFGNKIEVKKLPIEESAAARLQFRNFMKTSSLSISQQIKQKFVQYLPPRVFKLLKEKFRPLGPLTATKLDQLHEAPPFKNTKVKINELDFYITRPHFFAAEYKNLFVKKHLLFQSTQPNPNIIDIGAVDGLSTYYFRKQYPSARLTVVEPNPESFSALEKNCRNFGLTPQNLINAAAGWTDSPTLFFTEGPASGRIAFETDKAPVLNLPTIDVLSLIEEPIDLLRINFPGAELHLLRRLQPVLSKITRICLQHYSFLNQPQTLDEILAILREARFRVYLDHDQIPDSPFLKRKHIAQTDLTLSILAYKQ